MNLRPPASRNDGATSIGAASIGMFGQCRFELRRQHRKGTGGGGSIVNIGSHYGAISPDPRIYTDCNRKNSEIYGATKAAVIQMTKYFAVHSAEYNVRTNAVSPGGILDSDNPQGEDFQKNYSFRCPMGKCSKGVGLVFLWINLILNFKLRIQEGE